MSENIGKDSVSGNALSRAAIAEMLMKNYDKLPDLDRKLFAYGPMYLGGNAGLAGLISNSLYRRVLNVSQARMASALPMAMLPFMTTVAIYYTAVSSPLLMGDLNCPTCALMRGALVGVLGGGVYPILLALPINLSISSKYNTAPMPEKGNVLRYWVDISRPIMRKMRAVLLLQGIFGTYLSSRHFEIYTQLTQITFGQGEKNLND